MTIYNAHDYVFTQEQVDLIRNAASKFGIRSVYSFQLIVNVFFFYKHEGDFDSLFSLNVTTNKLYFT